MKEDYAVPMRTLLLILLLLLTSSSARAACDGDGAPLPPMYEALVEAERLVDAGSWAAALERLAGAANVPAGPAARRRDLLTGRARLESGDLTGGRTALLAASGGRAGEAGYRPSPCDADPGVGRWWLAQGAVARGDEGAAATTWEKIWTDNPASPRAADAKAALAGLGQALPDASDERGRDRIRRRASTLAGLQQHRDALALYDLLPDDGSDGHRRALARASFKARKYERSIELYQGLTDKEPGDLFELALATSRLGDYANAALIYGELVELHPSDAMADKASFKLGYLAWDGGDLAAAVDRFTEHRERYPRSRQKDEALWFSGWALMRLGRLDEALAAMEELAGQKSSLAAGGAYWAARIQGRMGHPDSEAEGLEVVLREHADTVYAWWAARLEGRTWAAPDAVAPPDPADLQELLLAGQAAMLGRAMLLAEAGLHDWATAELAPLTGAVKGDRERALALAQALADAGAWPASRRLAQPWCKHASERKDLVALRLCWPRPDGDAVQRAAADAGLPPLLPFAIMRAESGFNPEIVSPAGARGLMQLMPDLGVALYGQLHPGETLDPDALFDPAINTELGVAELGGLRRSLATTGVDPVLPLVIAGYNGGEGAVRRWLVDEPSPLDVDRWAEEISYGETRRYVRRVLGTLQVYRYVYGDP